MAAKSGESRAGLVVFLVLFILLSIGLGVTTYMGYGEVDKAKQEATAAKADAAQKEADSDYWKFHALTYRAYIGYPVPAKDDLAARRKQYNSGQGNIAKGRDENGKDEHRKTLTVTLGDQTPKKWDDAIGKPSETFLDELDRVKKERDAALKSAADEKKKADDASQQVATLNSELTAAKKDYLAKLDQQKTDDTNELKRKEAAILDLQKRLDARGEENPGKLKPLEKEIADLRAAKLRLEKDLKLANKTIDDRRDELARSQSAEELDITRIAPENLAKIVSINGAGDMPYISLGSADNLKRAVTFSIYGKGVDGRPLKEPKGKLEVLAVTGAHLSQAKITELRDERRDPVLPGDFIYNPTWNPNLKQHVAIIGVIDLTGEGRDQIQDFMRTLKNQNVEVDAYLDMKTTKLKKPSGEAGELTRQTDLLIVGAGPDYGSKVIRAGDPKGDGKDAVLKTMQDVTNQAEKLGVRIVRLNNYLETSGYPLPKALGSEKPKIGFQRNLDAAGSPIERKPPQQPQK